MSPFAYVNSISYSKKIKSLSPLDESIYNTFITNRNFSYFVDTILIANEINMRHTADKKLQYDYLLNKIRPRKRFSKWNKHVTNGNIELIKEYYKVNDIKAKTILTLLSEQQIDHIKTKLSKGGVK
tara:strand:+ start:546 stop:923 length:378 start_codon:yes stop_codon:yes gene_type:complete